MTGFRAGGYAGIAGADLENAPSGPVPFTSSFGLPVTRMQIWHAGGGQPGANSDGVPGTRVQHASGNPDVATIPGVPPPKSPYGWPRPLGQDQESATPRQPMVPGQNTKMLTRDRHPIAKVGYENSGRNSGVTDPPSDGPARPSYQLVQRTINYQQGTDNTLTQDDMSRDYTRIKVEDQGTRSIGWIAAPNVGPQNGTRGREGALYAGEQGTGWARIYGGVPGLYQPYGSYEGVTNGPVTGIQSPVALGAQGDGPRNVWSGPPHGLHSPTLPSYDQTLGRYMAIPQMNLPRVDRPANSPIAGQSYSQTVQPQGQTGTAVGGTGPSGPAFNQRFAGNGWRGRGAG